MGNTTEELAHILKDKNLNKIMPDDIKLYKIMKKSYAIFARNFGALMWQNQNLASLGNDIHEKPAEYHVPVECSGGEGSTGGTLFCITYCFSTDKHFRRLESDEVLLEFSLYDVINFAKSFGLHFACGYVNYGLVTGKLRPDLATVAISGDIHINFDSYNAPFFELPCLLSTFMKGRSVSFEKEYRLVIEFNWSVNPEWTRHCDKYVCLVKEEYVRLISDLFSKAVVIEPENFKI